MFEELLEKYKLLVLETERFDEFLGPNVLTKSGMAKLAVYEQKEIESRAALLSHVQAIERFPQTFVDTLKEFGFHERFLDEYRELKMKKRELEQENQSLRQPRTQLASITYKLGEMFPDKKIGDLRAMTLLQVYEALTRAGREG